uniref:Extracellular solute-binding protein family 1 n=1 Tax=uncultured bacterium Contig99 TaxID=1393639 RepID=W0FLW0_9BACT|nr:extracellular solute-binding protein family 1 [uncultured bacterium Contig99]
MKKLVSLLLCMLMVFACMGTALADHIEFSMTSYNTITGVDYTSDDFYKFIAEKFDVTIDIWGNEADGASEREHIWMNGGTMPNAMIWESFDYGEYVDYVDQELLKPLPDGWQERWPNLAKLVKVSGMAEALEIDGQTYAIPHSVFGNYLDMDPIPSHFSITFRYDLACEVGMEDLGKDSIITLSELRAYLEALKANNLIAMPCIADNTSNTLALFYLPLQVNSRAFRSDENGYHWIFENPSDWTELLTTMQDWYQNGLIDADFYQKSYSDYRNLLTSGQMAAICDSGDCVNFNTYRAQYQAAFPDRDPYYDLHIAAVASEDGKAYANQAGNYWTMQMFAPETDDATLERILDVMDYIASMEGQAAVQIGVPGVDWEYDADGKIVILNPGVTYPSQEPLYLLGYCNDDFAYSGAKSTLDIRNIDEVKAVYAKKSEAGLVKYEMGYATYSSPLRSNYSLDTNAILAQIVVSGADPESTLQQFVDENVNIWKPLQDELNQYFGFTK